MCEFSENITLEEYAEIKITYGLIIQDISKVKKGYAFA